MTVKKVNIADYATEATKIFGSYVVENRALPDFRDGLKPVHRRILWAMYKLGLKPNGNFTKTARVTGEVIGKYHPHGDKCLDGNTLVYSLDNKIRTIKELYSKNKKDPNMFIWVLAYDKNTKTFVPAKANNFRIGKTVTKTYKIYISDGSYIECSDNHKFYIRNKGWVRADSLKPTDLLQGGVLDTKHKNNNNCYIRFKPAGAGYLELHKLIGNFFNLKGDIVHHKNFISTDNRPKNLKGTDRETHAKTHKDYLSGLDKGRIRMFSEDSDMRKAIQKKNSLLMSEYNKNLPIIKAINIIKLILKDRKKPTINNYIKYRSKIYNGTKLETLKNKGITFKKLLNMVNTFSLDTSKATGLTIKYKNKKGNYDNDTNKYSHRLSILHNTSKILETLFVAIGKFPNKITKHNFGKAKRLFIKKSNITQGEGRFLPKFITVKKEYCKYIEALKGEGAGGCLLVKKIDIVKHNTPKVLYDFSVKNYENMLIPTTKNKIRSMVVVHNSTSDAIETLVKMPEQLVQGYGEWGDADNPAASPRYTEVRLSNYSATYLLDPIYLECVPMVLNYDGRDKEPVYLPAKLPNLLINGTEGIAVGCSNLIPSFSKESVVEITKLGLKRKITVKDCLDILDFKFTFGGEEANETEELKSYYKTGNNQLYFIPTYTRKGNVVTIKSRSPRFNYIKIFNNISELTGVVDVSDESEGETTSYVITIAKSYTKEKIKTVVEEIEECLYTSLNCQTIVMKKQDDGEGADFKRTTIPAILNNWIKWRIALEKKVVNYLIKIDKDKQEKQEWLILAIDNKEEIIKALNKKDPVSYLVKKLKQKKECINFILDLKVRRLAKIERKEIAFKISGYKTNIKSLRKDLKNINKKISATLN